MKSICVIGNFSGRNAGDAAILEGLLNDIYSINQNVDFLIPTINRSFVEKTYCRFPIRAIPLMPWNGSLKIFGLPIFRAVSESDLVLITDAILFDRRLWNPIHNYLSTMSLVVPFANRKNVPIVLYNVSLGPVTSYLGRRFLKKILDNSDLLITRDQESIELLNALNIKHKNIKNGADSALNIHLPPTERLNFIVRTAFQQERIEPYMTFNIHSYIDAFVKQNKSRIGTDRFLKIIAQTIDQIICDMGLKVVILLTQVMDYKLAKRLMNKLKNRHHVSIIANHTYTHNDLAGILARAQIHVGMRTHSLIFATSSCTPTISIITYPKNRAYMKTIQQEDRIIEFGDSFTADKLFELVRKTWTEREHIREKLKPIIKREKAKAKMSAEHLRKYLHPYMPQEFND